MKISELPDPFKEAREGSGVGHQNDQDDPVLMALRLKDVRKGAHNWKGLQSGAKPGRIVIPSEVAIRETRQIPFEVDPPEHKGYRDLVEPWFKRPTEEPYRDKLREIINGCIDDVLAQDKVEVVGDFSLKLQSRALTVLLNIPYEESKVWIDWGTHVFRSEDSDLDGDKAAILYDYIDEQIDRAIANPGDDLYSVLLAADVNGKKMSKEEVKGVMILTFAGGRDTVINTLTNSIAYFADHPESLERLRQEPEIRNSAIEELIRYFSPLTQMGRVATEDQVVCEHAVKADTRVGLCWASANRDEKVFPDADKVVLDRKVNPHLAFGFGTHNCLGSTHARAIMAILIEVLCEKVQSIDILEHKDNIEDLDQFKRKVGFDSITAQFNAR
ncbi:cytochrome P450 [Agaribacterium haliotis]|uniref:cytochrome P450 n=1 Tax=Agaribacterium haliotis TaxID=2013869 RepID=UPI000BB5872F|nr:cytochrome P450 [Agaribacterium haliotis]